MNLFHEAKSILDKDGKVNPLGPYGRQKLTGREVSTYFRRNPVKDAQIKKAVEVALDLQGAMTVANKEIRKFYGDKVLKSKEVQTALKYANESVEHDIREDLNEGMKLAQIVRKHKSALMKAKKSGNLELPQKAEDDLANWANNNGEIHGDDPDDFIDWLDSHIDDLVPTLKIRESVKEDVDDLRRQKKALIQKRDAKNAPSGSSMTSIINRIKDLDKKIKAAQMKQDQKDKIQLARSYAKKGSDFHSKYRGMGIGESLEEARSTISTPMYKVLSKMGIQQLMKKHDAYINKGETDKNHTTISTPSGGFHKDLTNLIKKNKNKIRKLLPEQPEYQGMSLQEVTDKEIQAMRKVSKDMQNVLKSYQKIATMGDNELKNTKHNYDYKQVLQARDTIVSMIGKLQTRQTIEKSMKKESYSIADTYRIMNDHDNDEFLKEGKVLKFTNIKDKTLEKHLKVVTKKVGAKLDKISGGFAVSDTDMRGFTAVVDYIFDKSIKKNMLDGGGMSDVTMSNESNNHMWEDAIEENIERGIMRKMRKGRVAKGMPR